MNISNHCYQRYHERVRKQTGPFVDSLKEKYTKELETLYSHCTKIYSGVIGHSSKPVDVYVNNHGWVLITNDKEKLMITLYKIGLGIGDDELDQAYISKSLVRISELQEVVLKKALSVDEDKKSYKEKIEANEALIKEYTGVINNLKNANDDYRDLIKNLDASYYSDQIRLRDAIENYMVKDIVKIDIEVK